MRRESNSERAAWTALVEGKPAAPNHHKALGRLKPGERNKTEAAYEQHLELRQRVGEILWYRFEGITFKLADDTRYTPDFAVMLADKTIECHELKGTTSVVRKSGVQAKVPYFQDDAKVKIKIAASLFPMLFKVVYKVDGNWVESEV